ncbi:hypothetical protein O181_012493 [Austropuccinia psidii MF-1]|uniref:Uncharacterized protein n=1 Tax=Austropuccinia psidii MF-1 TaxID=1389203 RepID=A0A9Q3GM94_9BASI|nr:hypothetical protein [Austropuccinia psidii MF-1]
MASGHILAQFGLTGSRQRDVARWTNVGGPISVGGRPIYSSSGGPISRTNTKGIVKRIRRIVDSPPDPDDEGSDQLDASCQEIPKSNYPQCPRDYQPTLSAIPTSIPPASTHSSHTRHALNPAVRPSPIQQPRNSPIVTSKQLQPVASTTRIREELSPWLLPAGKVFQSRNQWPIRVTREYPNTTSENKNAVARLFRREVIMYANDRTVPGTTFDKMAAKYAWYED